MNENINISVIIPCYNQAVYLEEALESVLQQTHQNWECIIVNDGSTDSTEEKAQQWLKKDSRFKLLSIENNGLAHARNYALKSSTGDYIQFLDADDILDKNKMLFSVEQFSGNDVDIVISNFKYFSNDIQSAYHPKFQLDKEFLKFENILMLWPTKNIPIHCGIFRSELFSEIKFIEDLKACEDWVMWLKLFRTEIKVNYLDKPLAFYRQHDLSMTMDFRTMDPYRIKAIEYIQENIVMDNDLLSYFLELQKHKTSANKMAITNENYRNTRIFRASQFMKKIMELFPKNKNS